jgi:hypothetical protein
MRLAFGISGVRGGIDAVLMKMACRGVGGERRSHYAVKLKSVRPAAAPKMAVPVGFFSGTEYNFSEMM